MHDADLILTLTGGLAAALVLGYVTHGLRLSPIVGYLLAGIAIGPFTPGFEADRRVAEQLAEVGVVLLMFGVGLRFRARELLDVWRVAVPGALVQSMIATLLGAGVGRLVGWDWTTGLVFGGAISVASTVVLVRVLADAHALHARTGHVAVGWLVVEDLITVVALVALPAVVRGGGDAWSLSAAVGLVVLRIAALVGLLALAGSRLVPRALEWVAATRSRELFTLAVLVVALGIAVGSAQVFGVSMALGAFLAGMIVGRSDFGLRAASEALPMRDAFAVLFFVSVGMMFDPAAVLREAWLVVATLGIVTLAKPATALAVALAAGQPLRVALPVAAALAQIGEFSFILAALGRDLGVVPPAATDALVAVALVSITLNPAAYRFATRLAARLDRRDAEEDAAPAVGEDEARRAVIVGYGPVGQTVCQLLLDNGIVPTVIELNLDTVRRLRAFDVRAVYGDAARPEVLAEAGVDRARHLVLTAGTNAEEIVRRAKESNPGIHVLARSAYVRALPRLRRAAADDVFSDEGEVALALTTRILEHLGATAEQVDRERRRIEETFRAG